MTAGPEWTGGFLAAVQTVCASALPEQHGGKRPICKYSGEGCPADWGRTGGQPRCQQRVAEVDQNERQHTPGEGKEKADPPPHIAGQPLVAPEAYAQYLLVVD